MRKRREHFKSSHHRKETRPQAAVDRSAFVMGRNCMRELAKMAPERLEQVYVSARENLAGVPVLENLKITVLPASELTALVGSDSHQGVVVRVRPRAKLEWADFLHTFDDPEKAGLILALDGVTDPHNLGAILRAAECFKVDAVVWSKNRSSGITPVVTKVSVGASELVTCIEVSNLAEAARRARSTGFWIVVADGGEGAADLNKFSFPERTLLILGAEGEGVSHLLLERSDFRVRIPMYGQIDSLNVSQAAAVLLYWARSPQEISQG